MLIVIGDDLKSNFSWKSKRIQKQKFKSKKHFKN